MDHLHESGVGPVPRPRRTARLRNGWNFLALIAFLCGILVALAYATDPGAPSRIVGSAFALVFLVCLVRLPFVRAELRGGTVREVNIWRRRDWHPVAAKPIPGAGYPIGSTWVVGLVLDTGEMRTIWWQTVYGREKAPPCKIAKFCDEINVAVNADATATWPDPA